MTTENELSKAPAIVQGMVVASQPQSKIDQLGELSPGGRKAIGANNFDGDSKQKWRLLMLATGPGSEQGANLVGEVIDIKYWYAHRVSKMDPKTGEVDEFPRIVFIDSKCERAVWFCSNGILEWLQNAISFNGEGVFAPSLRGEVVRIKTPMGYTFKLAAVEDEVPATPVVRKQPTSSK